MSGTWMKPKCTMICQNPLGEFRQLDALARHDVRDILEIHRQRDYGS
jgi:hypothetical protein